MKGSTAGPGRSQGVPFASAARHDGRVDNGGGLWPRQSGVGTRSHSMLCHHQIQLIDH